MKKLLLFLGLAMSWSVGFGQIDEIIEELQQSERLGSGGDSIIIEKKGY